MNAKPIAGVVVAAGLLGACAALAPLDELTWSSELAKSLPRQEGSVSEVARFSRLRPGAFYNMGDGEPFIVVEGSTPTVYRPVERDGVVVIEADSGEGSSALYRKIQI